MKILKLFLLTIMLISVLAFVNAADAQTTAATTATTSEQFAGWNIIVQPVCKGVCVEGSQAVFRVNIQNTGTIPLYFSQVSLFDSEGITFATQVLDPKESGIQVGEKGTVDITGIVPPPSRSSTLYYTVGLGVNGQAARDNNIRNMYVMPASDIECSSNDFCEGTDICYNYQCMPYELFNSSVVEKPKEGVTTDSIQIGLLLVIVILLIVFILVSLRNVSVRSQKKR